jgi:hypothetical protein
MERAAIGLPGAWISDRFGDAALWLAICQGLR